MTGRYDTLEVETRNFKGPRTVEFSGIPLHDDNETVVKERISVDPANLLAAYPTVNNFVVASVPEPSTYALMLLGLAAIGRTASRRLKR